MQQTKYADAIFRTKNNGRVKAKKLFQGLIKIKDKKSKTNNTDPDQTASKACRDPESFVRGGPNLLTFFFLVDEGI